MKTLAIICAVVMTINGIGFADPTPSATGQASSQTASFTPEQLDSLVAPIALYPDELVSQILVACTYPLEIVQAYQWVQQHPELKGKDLVAAAQKQSWDPSIQALVAFPDVLKRLNQDVTWTTNLGNAFLANQAGVMDEIQKMRSKAEDNGKLVSTPQEKVTNTTEEGRPVVQIEPANPDVVYVPDYDPAWIWGPAPLYYPYPYWYYPPPPPFGGWCWWGPEIFLGALFLGWTGWIGWGWHPHWYDHSVFVNRGFFEVNHFNAVRFNDVHGGAVWVHNSDHRMGVAYPNRALSAQFHGAAAHAAFSHVSVAQARQQFQAAGARVQADRFGSRQVSPGVFNRNHTAFGGIEGGQAARAHSSRGYSSLGHARSSWGGGGGRSTGGGSWGGGGGHSSGGGWGGGGGHR